MSQTYMVLVGDNTTPAMPAILPKSWICTNLGQVIEYGKVDKVEPNNISDDTWVLELADIEKDSSAIIQRISFRDRQSKSTKNKFKKGDVLYSKLRPYLNKVIIANSSGVCTTEIIPLSCGANLDNRYLFYWLKHPTFLAYVNTVGYGVNMPRLGTKDGIAAPFVLAPFAEQQQISAKLDELLEQVDIIKNRLDTVPKILKRFRQSVLAAAVSGELTEDWREENEYIAGFPSSWSKKRLSDVGKLARGKSKHRPRNAPELFGTEYPFIQTGEVANSGGRINKATKFYSQLGLQQSKLFLPGTLCITIAANIADTAILDISACFPDSIVGFTPNANSCVIEFVKYLVDANKTNLEACAPATAQKNINLKVLDELLLPFPPIEEQTEIVAQAELLFAFANQVEQRVKDAHKRVNRLTQAILTRAFSGELTVDWRAQNPDLISGENSAEALLTKIKAEREALAKNKPTKSRIKKTGESMKPKNIMPIIETLKAAGQPLSSQDLLAQAGYPSDADTDQLETFFLDIREQLNAKTITRERKGDKEFFAIAE